MIRAAPYDGAAPTASEAPHDGVSGDAGFTVLETLIAFVILVGLTAGMLQIFKTSGEIAGRSEQLLETAEVARSVLARIGADIPAEEGFLEFSEGPVAVTVALTAYEPGRVKLFEGEPEALLAEVTAANERGGRPVTLTSIVVTTPEAF